MKLTVLNGCDCDECNYPVSNINGGTPSQVGPMNGTPSQIGPMNGGGFYPNDLVADAMNGMDDDEAQAYELALIMDDQLAVNGLYDEDSLNGWRDRRKQKKAERKEKRAEKKQERKDRRANTAGKNRRVQRRAERDARRQRRQERHERRMSGEGGSWLDTAKDIAGGLVSKFSGDAIDAAEDMYDEGIEANPEVIYEMDQAGSFKNQKSGGDGEGKDNTMMYVIAAAAGLYFLSIKR